MDQNQTNRINRIGFIVFYDKKNLLATKDNVHLQRCECGLEINLLKLTGKETHADNCIKSELYDLALEQANNLKAIEDGTYKLPQVKSNKKKLHENQAILEKITARTVIDGNESAYLIQYRNWNDDVLTQYVDEEVLFSWGLRNEIEMFNQYPTGSEIFHGKLFSTSTEGTCVICQMPFGERCKEALLCLHVFHLDCIVKNFTLKNKCPICAKEEKLSTTSISIKNELAKAGKIVNDIFVPNNPFFKASLDRRIDSPNKEQIPPYFLTNSFTQNSLALQNAQNFQNAQNTQNANEPIQNNLIKSVTNEPIQNNSTNPVTNESVTNEAIQNNSATSPIQNNLVKSVASSIQDDNKAKTGTNATTNFLPKKQEDSRSRNKQSQITNYTEKAKTSFQRNDKLVSNAQNDQNENAEIRDLSLPFTHTNQQTQEDTNIQGTVNNSKDTLNTKNTHQQAQNQQIQNDQNENVQSPVHSNVLNTQNGQTNQLIQNNQTPNDQVDPNQNQQTQNQVDQNQNQQTQNQVNQNQNQETQNQVDQNPAQNQQMQLIRNPNIVYNIDPTQLMGLFTDFLAKLKPEK